MNYLISSADTSTGHGNMYVVELPDKIEVLDPDRKGEVMDIRGEVHSYFSYLNMDELNGMVEKYHD